MLENNTKQINLMISKIYAICSLAIIFMTVCSLTGVFEFGTKYTYIVLIAGLIVSLSPGILIHFLSDNVMKYYMLIILVLFIGVIATDETIGIYMTYALVPIISCLYFEPVLTKIISVISYIAMIVAVYFRTGKMYEVVLLGRNHNQIFLAYALGFTVEFLIIGTVLNYIVKRAKKIMEERHSAEEENRMKSEFLSSMSHEIRTPMNAIVGMADVALQKEMNEDLKKCLMIIKSSSEGLIEIINDILDISKIEAGKLSIIKESYSTEELVGDMKVIIDARDIYKKVPIFYHVEENIPPYLKGDVIRIKQIMLNFASNAIKYTDSGRIDVYFGCRLQDDVAVLTFSVKDTGQGIKEENMDKLFVMYSQLEQRKNYGKEGTGIGLCICKQFVDKMHGTLNVKSEYGVGSTFSFAIPQEITSKPENAGNSDMGAFTTRNVKVLLVDDNEINREVVRDMLEPLNVAVIEAKDGKEAVDMVGKDRYDLIFMDSHMPEMDGKEATRSIRQMEGAADSRVPIIALTADAIAGVREQLLACGMDDYLVKPVNMENLFRMMKKYLPKEKIMENKEK